MFNVTNLDSDNLAVPQASIKEFCASVVILNEIDEILLILRDDYPLWENVGGFLDDNENFENALKREVFEEIGLEIDAGLIFHDFFTYRDYTEPAFYQQERVYLCKINSSEKVPKLGSEGVAIRWFKRDNIPDNILPDCKARILEITSDKSKKKNILKATRMLDHLNSLEESKIFGLEEWVQSSRVLAKRNKGVLRYWPREKLEK